MIIDFRMRPPFGGYRSSAIFTNTDFQGPFARKFGFELAPSVWKMSMALMLEEMAEAGIDKAVVPVRRLANAQVTNEELLEFLQMQGKDKFYGMAGVDPLEGEGALEEIERYIVNGPCVGLTLEPGYCFKPLKADDEILYPIYEKCQRENIPIFLSFGGLVGPYMEYNNPIFVDHVAADFPDLKLILAHGGYPYVTQSCYVAFSRPNVYLVPDFYATRVPGGDQYMQAAQWISDKIIFGSGYPIQPLKGMVDYYREKLTPDIFEQVAYKNAAKILNLESIQ